MTQAYSFSVSKPWKIIKESEYLKGNFCHYSQFSSQHLRHDRDILVYLPPGYGKNSRTFPVLYMHDGNNLFDPDTAFLNREWHVDEHMERLISTGEIEEVIVVGIYNTPDRNQEYTWIPRKDDEGCVEGGDGPRYARFLVEELKPEIDRTFRTRPEREFTGVAGSSLGGLISFYLGLYYPDIFSHIGMVSPSLWWQNELLLPEARHLSHRLKVWIDMGTKESDLGVAQAKAFVTELENQGYVRNKNFVFELACCAEHNEQAWSLRVSDMLKFFYGLEAL